MITNDLIYTCFSFQALRVEMNYSHIQAYLSFLTKHVDFESSRDLAFSLAETLAYVITQRKSVIDMVLKENGPRTVEIYKCLLSVMTLYIKYKRNESFKDEVIRNALSISFRTDLNLHTYTTLSTQVKNSKKLISIQGDSLDF